MGRAIAIMPYDERWPAEFDRIGMALRESLGDLALRIDHIGSTAVPGLAAKDVIDVQVTVAALDAEAIATALAPLGYTPYDGIARDHVPPNWNDDPAEWRKLYFDVPAGQRPTHLHVRQAGRANQRYALLFRDYLRTNPTTAAAYGQVKEALARLHPDDEDAYYDVKEPVCDIIIDAAERWFCRDGLRPRAVGPLAMAGRRTEEGGRKAEEDQALSPRTTIATSAPNLRLVALTPDDAAAYYEVVDRSRAHLTQHGDYLDLEEATPESVLADLSDPDNRNHRFGVWLDGRLIGRVDLVPRTQGNFVLGYWLGGEFTGHGYATRACQALIAYGQAELGATNVYAGVTKGNARSEALLGRLGFRFVEDRGIYTLFTLPLAETAHDQRDSAPA